MAAKKKTAPKSSGKKKLTEEDLKKVGGGQKPVKGPVIEVVAKKKTDPL